MALDTDLMGLGMAPELARLSGFNVQAVTAAGSSSQANAAALTGDAAVVTTTTSNQGVRLPSGTNLAQFFFVVNLSSNAVLVYPPVGATMNGTANASFSVAQNKPTLFFQPTNGAWYALLSA